MWTAGKLGVADWAADSARPFTPLGKRADEQNSAHCLSTDCLRTRTDKILMPIFALLSQRLDSEAWIIARSMAEILIR